MAGQGFDHFHDQLRLSDDQVRESLREGQFFQALGQALAEKLLEWARANVAAGTEPEQFESLVRDGWTVPPAGPTPPLSVGLADKGVELHPLGQPRHITLAHAYCLFFRERLRSEPRVFNDFVADTLNALHNRLEQQGTQVSADLADLREAVARLAAQPPVFSQFEAWLTPQLGELKDLLAGVQDQLGALARGNKELKEQQGEIVVAITALRTEVLRGNPNAQRALEGLTAHVTRLERKLNHLIGGLPITRFRLPDPLTHELELLYPKHRAVTLLGRDRDLCDLCAWVESAEPISARLLVGEAGTGKTRLALELLLRVNTALPHWQAGLLGGEDLQRLVERTHTPDFHWAAPTLLGVDYAQALAGPLTKLLRAFTHLRNDGRPRLRLLLLERQAGEWFDDLQRQDDSVSPCSVRNLFHPPEPVALTRCRGASCAARFYARPWTRLPSFGGKPPSPCRKTIPTLTPRWPRTGSSNR